MWSQHSTSAGMIQVSTSTGRTSTATGLPVSCVYSMNIEGEGDLLQHFKPKDEMQMQIKIYLVTAQRLEYSISAAFKLQRIICNLPGQMQNKNFKGQRHLFFVFLSPWLECTIAILCTLVVLFPVMTI